MGMKGKVCLVYLIFMTTLFLRGYQFFWKTEFFQSISNTISFDQLKKAMHLGDLGDQVVLKSEMAFEHIRFLNSERVLRTYWLEKKKDRDSRARKAYFSMDRESYIPGGLYITRILDEEMKRDDPRIR